MAKQNNNLSKDILDRYETVTVLVKKHFSFFVDLKYTCNSYYSSGGIPSLDFSFINSELDRKISFSFIPQGNIRNNFFTFIIFRRGKQVYADYDDNISEQTYFNKYNLDYKRFDISSYEGDIGTKIENVIAQYELLFKTDLKLVIEGKLWLDDVSADW